MSDNIKKASNHTNARGFFHHYQARQDQHSTLRQRDKEKQSGHTVRQHVLPTSSSKLTFNISPLRTKQEKKENLIEDVKKLG